MISFQYIADLWHNRYFLVYLTLWTVSNTACSNKLIIYWKDDCSCWTPQQLSFLMLVCAYILYIDILWILSAQFQLFRWLNGPPLKILLGVNYCIRVKHILTLFQQWNSVVKHTERRCKRTKISGNLMKICDTTEDL